MEPTNLWKIPEEAEPIRTPTTTLKEQAAFLSKMTDRILIWEGVAFIPFRKSVCKTLY